jgi:hypothetical protein
MNRRSFLSPWLWGLVAGIAVTAQPRECRANISPGYDLFVTDPSGTFVPGLGHLMGVPLGTFNFGGSIGSQFVGNTDTIVHRLDAVPGDMGTTRIQIVALQLETVTPVNLGFGLHNYFVTLNGAQNVGSMLIMSNGAGGGTFDTLSLPVNFKVTQDQLSGPVVMTGTDEMISFNSSWSHTAPPGALKIDGVNNRLNGVDTSTDFWTGSVDEHDRIDPRITHTVNTPEPATWIAWVLVGLAAPAYVRWGRRRA